MEISSVVNSMQKFIDRLDGLNEEGRSYILKFSNVPLQYIEESTGKDATSDGWNQRTVSDGFEITDEFMIQREDGGEPKLFIKFNRKQSQDFTIKRRDPIMKEVRLLNNLFRKEEVLDYYTDAVSYNVEYNQEYFINADNITIINIYKGKCS